MDGLPLGKLIGIAELFRKSDKLDKCECILRRAIELHPGEVKPSLCMGKLILQLSPASSGSGSSSSSTRPALLEQWQSAVDVVVRALAARASKLTTSSSSSSSSTECATRDFVEAHEFIAAVYIKMELPEEALLWCHKVSACFRHRSGSYQHYAMHIE
jgi:hypothetical protein